MNGKDLCAVIRRAGYGLATACLLFLAWTSTWAADPVPPPFIRFLGAAQMVGGSSALIDTGHLRVLLDCGSFQGPAGSTRNDSFDFVPGDIDYVVLTHAHIDHSGRIPLLFRKGFHGKVIGTDATKSLLAILWRQSLKIMEANGASDYDQGDVDRALRSFWVVPYDRKIPLSAHVGLRLRDAGHILGSAMMELWMADKTGPIKIVATGDMGSGLLTLFPPPAHIGDGDYVLVESTHGPALHHDTDERRFGLELRKTILSGGSVLIPAYALDRTQKVLYVLGRLKRAGVLPEDTPVYADSPSAAAVTGIYRQYGKHHAPELQKGAHPGDPLSFPGLREVKEPASLMAHEQGRPAIYVASSGMLDHGAAPRHLARMIGDERNLLAIVGWQDPASTGGRLQKGTKTIKIPGTDEASGGPFGEAPVKMRVKTFGVFTGHADGCQILTWLSRFPRTKRVIVVHGQRHQAMGLAWAVRENLGFATAVPALGDVIPLAASAPDYLRKPAASPCRGLRVIPDAPVSLDP